MIKIDSVIKMFGKIQMPLCTFALLLLFSSFHPYYVSMTELKFKEEDKTLEVSCRMFTDNLETTLRKLHKKQVDILHPKDKKETDKLVSEYVTTHLKISIDGKLQTLTFIGFEKEEDATWVYLEIKNISTVKSIRVENTLLYEYFSQQMNMVHCEVNEKKQSSKVTNPDKVLEFSF